MLLNTFCHAAHVYTLTLHTYPSPGGCIRPHPNAPEYFQRHDLYTAHKYHPTNHSPSRPSYTLSSWLTTTRSIYLILSNLARLTAI